MVQGETKCFNILTGANDFQTTLMQGGLAFRSAHGFLVEAGILEGNGRLCRKRLQQALIFFS